MSEDIKKSIELEIDEIVEKLSKSRAAQDSAMKHPNELGEGAKKRKKLKDPQDKFATVMREFYNGTLHSSDGKIVTDAAQAKAIAASESGMSKSFVDYAFGKVENLIKSQSSELKLGIKIESEHKDTIAQIIKDVENNQVKPFEHYFKNIAEDHIEELKNYYTELVAMENKNKDMKKSVSEETDTMKTKLFETIKNLGKEGLQKAMSNLSDAQADLLKAALEEMKKGGEGSKGGKVVGHTKTGKPIYETKGKGLHSNFSDDEHREAYFLHKEKSNRENFKDPIDPERARHIDAMNHHSKQIKEKTEDEKAFNRIMPIKKSDQENQDLEKAATMPKPASEKDAPSAKVIQGKLPDTKLQEEKADDDVDEKIAESAETKVDPQGAKSPDGEIKGQVIKSEASEKEDDKMEEKAKEKLADAVEEIAEGEAKEEKKEAKQEVKKSVVFTDENSLLKANTLGRNFHYSVNDMYNEAIETMKKAESDETKVEDLVKSEKEFDINDYIEKAMDESSADVIEKSLNKPEKDASINIVKSFADEDILDTLGLTEDEAKKLLGDK